MYVLVVVCRATAVVSFLSTVRYVTVSFFFFLKGWLLFLVGRRLPLPLLLSPIPAIVLRVRCSLILVFFFVLRRCDR